MYSRIFQDVQATVPADYLADFIAGYNEAVVKSASKNVCCIAETIDVSTKELKESKQPTASKTKAIRAQRKKGNVTI